MSLSTVTGEARTLLKWLGLIVVFFFILFLLVNIKNAIFPAPPPPPKVGFGKLPLIDFPTNTTNKKYSYSLNTITGTLPNFESSQKVYKMQEDKPDLLSLSRAKEKAKSIGFEENPTKISDNVYQWKNENGKILTMNILNFDFNVSSDYLLKKDIQNFNRKPDIAVSFSKDLLRNMDILPPDLDETKTTTNLYSIKDFKLLPATSLSTAQAVRVNFFQKDFNNLPIYYTSSTPMNFLIGTSRDPEVLEANFLYQKVSDFSSTYPIKTAQIAFDELKKGNAYIAQFPESRFVSINKVTLGYFVADKRQEFLMPIVVFEGNNFKAYVSAVTNEWVSR